MGKLEYAIDELQSAGWSTLDTSGCAYTPNGRIYPGVERVKREFKALGYDFTLTRTDLFDCYRAAWRDASGQPQGAVVGQTEEETAVYALAQLKRALTGRPAPTV